MSNYKLVIPKNKTIEEYGNFNVNEIVALLRKYKNEPIKVQFVADMMEE